MSVCPSGTYGIPHSAHDCPKTDKFPWITSQMSVMNLEEMQPGNSWSESYHQMGPYSPNIFTLNLCIKFESTLPENISVKQPNWPKGNYCIYHIADLCPTGKSHY